MRYKVPQNIDMPDRIVGPLTMIQFVEAVIGGGLAYVVYNGMPNPLNLLLAIIIGLFTLAIVFIKINERPFLFYFVAFIKFLSTPKNRRWSNESPDNFKVEIYKPPTKNTQIVEHKKLDKKQLEELAKNLDSKNSNNIHF